MATSLPPGLSQVTAAQRRTLLAAALGWMLDAFDAMLYARVLAHVMRDLGMTKGTAGLLNSLTLLASGIGGGAFGFLADRVGRKRGLMLSILTYSICSFASGLATSILMLAVARFILGLGMGGEWNTGATLVAETWPTEFRAKAISIVESSWALGFAVAALVAGPVSRYWGWRAVFFVGILPALLTLWIQRSVPESGMWEEQERMRSLRPNMKFPGWGLSPWLPPYLSLPVEHGGRGLGVMGTTTLLVVLNLFGMFPGYLSFGWVADHLGRRKAFLIYTLAAALLVPLYAAARSPGALLVLGTAAAFFGTGIFSGSGIIGSEIFPTSVRARALGITYNGARTMSSVAPLVIGRVGQSKGLSWAFYLCAAGYLLAP